MVLLKVLTEAWKSFLVIPRGVICDLLIKEQAKAKLNIPVINMVAIILNGQLPITPAAFSEFRPLLLLHMQESSKPLFTVAALTMGLLLARATETGLDLAVVGQATDAVRQLLTDMMSREKDKFVTVLHQLSKSYTAVLPIFMARILFLIPTLPATIKVHALDVLLAGGEFLQHPFVELKACGLYSWIKDRYAKKQVTFSVTILHCVNMNVSSGFLFFKDVRHSGKSHVFTFVEGTRVKWTKIMYSIAAFIGIEATL